MPIINTVPIRQGGYTQAEMNQGKVQSDASLKQTAQYTVVALLVLALLCFLIAIALWIWFGVHADGTDKEREQKKSLKIAAIVVSALVGVFLVLALIGYGKAT
jgi:hypothetical protein